MAKAKTQFVCGECGFSSGKWSGKCPGCDSWNTMVEEAVEQAPVMKNRAAAPSAGRPAKVYKFDEIPTQSQKRFVTGIGEFDRVLGGGVVPGSVVLSGGEPGIGKSTLMLQVAQTLSRQGKALYVSGEESAGQIKLRAQRLGMGEDVLVMPETELNSIIAGIEECQPQFLIVDSIQVLYDGELSSAPGSVSQVRGCATRLAQLAKARQISTFIIGHVTKEGAIAGPRVLEHIVDTVLYFEGERSSNLRILRAVKNRFGSTDEIGVFEMQDVGMVEVKNPSMLFEAEKDLNLGGISIFAATQGTRPMLLEMQALCSHTQINIPRRMASGIDVNRLYMICAVLEKKIGLKLYTQDIFVNVAGGMRVREYASDLALAVAIVSSLRNLPIDRNTAFIGEIGLAGEIRNVAQIGKRVAECERMGITRVFVPRQSVGGIKSSMQVEGVSTLSDVLTKVF